MPSPREIAETVNDRSKFEPEPSAEPEGGDARDKDYRANPVNPPPAAVPARLKGQG